MPFTVIAFDSDTARRLSRAFDLAWNYLEENPDYLFVSAELAREDLALAIIDLAGSGEVSPAKIANTAIELMRERAQPSVTSKKRTRH
jgi:hypothetical protein